MMKTIQNKLHLNKVDIESMNHQKNEDTSTLSSMNIFEYVVKPQQNAAKRTFNNRKSNKNLINFGAVAILSAILILEQP